MPDNYTDEKCERDGSEQQRGPEIGRLHFHRVPLT
jgi:hypothetical protein